MCIRDSNWLLISSIALLSELYETTGQLESLLANEAKKVARIERYSGESSMSFHQAQLRLALFELAFGKNFKLANTIMHRSYDQAVKTELDGTSPFHIPYLIGYADLYEKLEKLDSALYRSTEVIRLSELNYGKQSLNYLLASSRHAEFLMAAGRYPKALLTLQEVGNALENVNYPQQITLQKIYLILANLNRIIGEFDLSKKMLDKALTIDNRAVNKDFFVQAETSEQLALLYLQTNNYYRAEKFATKSHSLKREKLHASNPLFYSTYLLLAALKSSLGDLAAIEPLLEKASTLSEEVY